MSSNLLDCGFTSTRNRIKIIIKSAKPNFGDAISHCELICTMTLCSILVAAGVEFLAKFFVVNCENDILHEKSVNQVQVTAIIAMVTYSISFVLKCVETEDFRLARIIILTFYLVAIALLAIVPLQYRLETCFTNNDKKTNTKLNMIKERPWLLSYVSVSETQTFIDLISKCISNDDHCYFIYWLKQIKIIYISTGIIWIYLLIAMIAIFVSMLKHIGREVRVTRILSNPLHSSARTGDISEATLTSGAVPISLAAVEAEKEPIVVYSKGNKSGKEIVQITKRDEHLMRALKAARDLDFRTQCMRE